MADVDIREGFLCPMCKKDLGTITQLQDHFEDAHSTDEDKDVLDQLKGFFGKAKRKLLRQDKDDEVFGAFGNDSSADGPSNASSGNTMAYNAGGFDPSLWDPQETGQTRNYTDTFRHVRDARIDHVVVETNKIVIRLDKLISPDAPTEPSKRKAFEKGIVPWEADANVSLCEACTKPFTLTRRRHHCRLCGGIICNKCSQFLPCSYAKKLTNPAFRYDGEGFRRSSSNSSLNSIMSPEGEMVIRTCNTCRMLLERRDQQMEQRNSKPMVVQLYDKMKLYMDQTEELLPNFLQMTESLNSGETTYSVLETLQLRSKIVKLYENIDALSKRILTLGLNSAEPPSSKQLLLQRKIRMCASGFMQNNVLGLQAVPTEEEFKALQERRRLEAQRRIEEERRIAAEKESHRSEQEQQQQALQTRREQEQTQRVKQLNQRSPTKGQGSRSPNKLQLQNEVVGDSGWKPVEVGGRPNKEDDPMIQQMSIIRGYVKQAKQAQKWDEVQMLEDNLRELQREYWSQQETQDRGRAMDEFS